MLSPRGGRPHDPTALAPSSSSSSTRHTGMEDDDAGASFGACGRVTEWEHGLPTADELTPVSQPIITPALAAAFRIDVAGTASPSSAFNCPLIARTSPTSHLSLRWDEDDDDDEEAEAEGDGDGDGAGEIEDAASGSGACRDERGGKKARMVWTPELHHRFVEAVAHLGDKGAVPKAIVRLMNVEGLTRENVASHLQKYRIYLKRTRTPARAQHLPAFSPAYGSHFRPQKPSDTSSRSDYRAFSAATAMSSNATKHFRLWDGNGPNA